MEKGFVEVVDDLLARQSAIESMFVGLVLALVEEEPGRLAKIVASLEFMRLHALVTSSDADAPGARVGFEVVLARLRAAQASPNQPRSALATELLMTAAVPLHQRDALRTWLGTMATPEEVGEEILDFAKRLAGSAAAPLAKKRAVRRKKDPPTA